MRRAFAVIRPVRIVLVEAEVWPNLAAEARNRRIPLALVNARLSKRSEARFQRFRSLIAPTFRCLDAICVQEPEDVERWVALGVSRERIHPVGSINTIPPRCGSIPDLPARKSSSLWDRSRQPDSSEEARTRAKRKSSAKSFNVFGRTFRFSLDYRAAPRNAPAASRTGPAITGSVVWSQR